MAPTLTSRVRSILGRYCWPGTAREKGRNGGPEDGDEEGAGHGNPRMERQWRTLLAIATTLLLFSPLYLPFVIQAGSAAAQAVVPALRNVDARAAAHARSLAGALAARARNPLNGRPERQASPIY